MSDGYKPLSPESKAILFDWLVDNYENPYPDSDQKAELAVQTKLHPNQINYFFVNARSRFLSEGLDMVIRAQAKNNELRRASRRESGASTHSKEQTQVRPPASPRPQVPVIPAIPVTFPSSTEERDPFAIPSLDEFQFMV